jgi:hypothetical protein
MAASVPELSDARLPVIVQRRPGPRRAVWQLLPRWQVGRRTGATAAGGSNTSSSSSRGELKGSLSVMGKRGYFCCRCE